MHTHYSKDSILSPRLFLKTCRKLGITPIVTDHDTIKGNLKLKCKILAEEISTVEGDLIGLFLTDFIPPKLSAAETIDRIKAQDGLVYAPHPFDRLRRSTLQKGLPPKLKLDIVEIFNARVLNQVYNARALAFAQQGHFLKAASSDAHTHFEIGNAYTVMEDFSSKKEFLKNLKTATFHTRQAPMWIHAVSKSVRRLKQIL